jgi:hypothetical protein
MSTHKDFSELTITMIETNIRDLEKNLVGKKLSYASNSLSDRDLELLFQSSTSVLSTPQQKMYEIIVSNLPKNLMIFLDPIIVSFALKDACDSSNADFVWIDLEGSENVGNSVWVKREDEKEVLKLMQDFLKHHLEKYLVDAYDRWTREDLSGIWEAKIRLKECPICKGNPFDQKLIKINDQKLRGWICSACGHHTILPSDTLKFIRANRIFFTSR